MFGVLRKTVPTHFLFLYSATKLCKICSLKARMSSAFENISDTPSVIFEDKPVAKDWGGVSESSFVCSAHICIHLGQSKWAATPRHVGTLFVLR